MFNPISLSTEREFYHLQEDRIAVGIDEAGRGSLAGPLSVGAVVFPKLFFTERFPLELRAVFDSKLLRPQERERVYSLIRELAEFAENVYISSRTIDKINVNRATELAIFYLVRRLRKRYSDRLFLLIDGNLKFPLIEKSFPFVGYRSIVKGDSLVFSIAAASVLAKVQRDRRMGILSKYFPVYELEKNKGYPTQRHRSQIKKLGISAIHRRSYSCVK